MAEKFACIAGQEVGRLREAGSFDGESLGRRQTPFGPSGEIYYVDRQEVPFYLLARQGPGPAKTSPGKVNDRANLYALRDLEVTTILGCGPAAAISHTFTQGDLVLVSDLLDLTRQRASTFFEDSPLGYLRQFPVFCPRLRTRLSSVLEAMGLVHRDHAVAAVMQGPRLETPAEVRMLAGMGAEIVTHLLAPEAFLARELQICYAGLCYVVDYAETGSRHQPFNTRGLFDSQPRFTRGRRSQGLDASLDQVIRQVVADLARNGNAPCDCAEAMGGKIRKYRLDAHWRQWFSFGQDP
jgi:5'-methylthioadenosine phosphorylase